MASCVPLRITRRDCCGCPGAAQAGSLGACPTEEEGCRASEPRLPAQSSFHQAPSDICRGVECGVCGLHGLRRDPAYRRRLDSRRDHHGCWPRRFGRDGFSNWKAVSRGPCGLSPVEQAGQLAPAIGPPSRPRGRSHPGRNPSSGWLLEHRAQLLAAVAVAAIAAGGVLYLLGLGATARLVWGVAVGAARRRAIDRGWAHDRGRAQPGRGRDRAHRDGRVARARAGACGHRRRHDVHRRRRTRGGRRPARVAS